MADELQALINNEGQYFVYVAPNSDNVDTFIEVTPKVDLGYISSRVIKKIVSYAENTNCGFFFQTNSKGMPTIVIFKF